MSTRQQLIALSAFCALAPCWIASANPQPQPSAQPPSASLEDISGNNEIKTAMDAVFPALVRIDVVMEEGGDGRMQKTRGVGSGAIITKDGYIVTNHHVAGRGTRFRVTLSNREEIDATFVGTDPLTDIAVIKINPDDRRDPKAPLPIAHWGDSTKLKVGDVVLAMGSPAGLSQSVTRGIVANTAMIAPPSMRGTLRLDGEDVGDLVRWIGHDAVIFGGNSGGPLVNLNGEIIGVNEVGIGSLGGAIPAKIGKAIAEEIIAQGTVKRSTAGIETQPLLRNMKGKSGVLVSSVYKNSPAEKAGIEPGDFIHTWDEQPVTTALAAEDIPLFNALVFATPVGKSVTITGEHNGQKKTWNLTTELREPASPREDSLDSWGITAKNITKLQAITLGRDNSDGIMIHSISPVGPAANAKPNFSPGDLILSVDGKPVNSLKDFHQISSQLTADNTKNAEILVKFIRNKAEFLSVLKIGPIAEKAIIPQASKPWLGASIQVYTRQLAKALNAPEVPGTRITAVVPDSPAQKAGLKTGDILTKLDGKPINANRPEDTEILAGMIRTYSPDSEIEFDVLRDAQPLKLKLTLGSTPKSSQEYPERKDSLFEFTFQDISQQQRIASELDQQTSGVVVTNLDNSGWAALAGIRAGDVLLEMNDQPIKDMLQLSTTLEKFRQEKPRHVTFKVRNGLQTRFLEVEPRW